MEPRVIKSEGKYLTKKEVEILKQEFEEIHFRSNLLFLRQHNGLRRANLHFLLSTTGGGKSTLLRTMFLDALASVGKNQKVLMYLTEETGQKFKYDIAQTGLLEHGAALKKKFDLVSETDCTAQELKGSLKFLLEQISSGEYGIVFLDNLTTARFYTTANYSNQVSYCDQLKAAAIKGNTALVIVGHTGKSVNGGSKNLIDPQDVRGQSLISNISEYIYSLQNFYANGCRTTLFNIIKNRDGNVKYKYWQLFYNQEMKIYSESRAVDFSVVKELFKGMDKL